MTEPPLCVCMFTNLFPPVVSGSSTQSAGLARELARRGHRPFVITARVDPNSPEQEENEGVPIYRLPCFRLPKMPIALNFPWLNLTFTPGNQRRIAALLRRHQPDVLHLHNHMFDLAFSAVGASRRLGLPLVITMHTVIQHTRGIFNLLLYPADRIFLRSTVIRHARRLICPDANMERHARRVYPTTPTAMVPYGITLPGTPTAEHVERIRTRHNLAGKRVILSLGHIHDVRCRRDEVAAMPDILKAVPNAVLLLVGAEATDIPRKLAGQLGVSNAVLFAGPAPHSDVPAYLALADLEAHLFYQDVEENTSLGIASLEAMAAGKVVIVAANEGSFGPGMLRDGQNVILVRRGRPGRLAEIIVALLRDDRQRQAIGSAAADFVRSHLAWDSVCAQTLAVYTGARGGSAAGGHGSGT